MTESRLSPKMIRSAAGSPQEAVKVAAGPLATAGATEAAGPLAMAGATEAAAIEAAAAAMEAVAKEREDRAGPSARGWPVVAGRRC